MYKSIQSAAVASINKALDFVFNQNQFRKLFFYFYNTLSRTFIYNSTNLSHTQLSTLQKYILIIFSLLFSLSFLRNINLRSPLMFKKKLFLKILSFCVFRFKGIVFLLFYSSIWVYIFLFTVLFLC